MNSSSFHLTDENKTRIAVASTDNDDLVSEYPFLIVFVREPHYRLLGRGFKSDESLVGISRSGTQ